MQQHGPSHKVGELPRIHELRRVVDAILYANKTSCSWWLLPKWQTWFEVTEAGAALCERYRAIREKCLIEHLTTGEEENRRLVELARALRKISGDYDAAARAATTNRP